MNLVKIFFLQRRYILFIKVNIPFKVLIMERKQVSFRVEKQIIKRLKFIALENDKSLTDIFLEAIEDLLEKYEKQVKKP